MLPSIRSSLELENANISILNDIDIDSDRFRTSTNLHSHQRLVPRSNSHSSADRNSSVNLKKVRENVNGTSKKAEVSSLQRHPFAGVDQKAIPGASFPTCMSKELSLQTTTTSANKRRKPRIQSGNAVKNIHSREDFRDFVASPHNASFPVLIRDRSFRIIRRRNLERRLVRLPHYHRAAAA